MPGVADQEQKKRREGEGINNFMRLVRLEAMHIITIALRKLIPDHTITIYV